MILLAYIILGHSEWSNGLIKIFALYPEESLEEERERLFELTKSGRLPISSKNIEFIPRQHNTDSKAIVNEKSGDADLTIVGFRAELLKQKGAEIFEGYENIGNVLFVNSAEEKKIT